MDESSPGRILGALSVVAAIASLPGPWIDRAVYEWVNSFEPTPFREWLGAGVFVFPMYSPFWWWLRFWAACFAWEVGTAGRWDW
jgi:hypothetical protein